MSPKSQIKPSIKPPLPVQTQVRERLHRASLSGLTGRKMAARASRKHPKLRALRNLKLQTIGGSINRLGEQRSQACPSVKPALTNQAQSRARLHRASLSGSAKRKVAARATRKCPTSRALSSHETAGYRRLDRSRGRATVAGRPIGEAGTHGPTTESRTSSQGFSLRFYQAESGGARNAQVPYITGPQQSYGRRLSAVRQVAWASNGRGPAHR